MYLNIYLYIHIFFQTIKSMNRRIKYRDDKKKNEI